MRRVALLASRGQIGMLRSLLSSAIIHLFMGPSHVVRGWDEFARIYQITLSRSRALNN